MNEMDDADDAVGGIVDTGADADKADVTLTVPKPRVKKQIREKVFSNSMVVRRETGEKILVPIEARDNRKANMVVVSMARELVKTQMDLYKSSGEILKPKELADITQAAKTVVEMSEKAYGEAEVNAGGAGTDNTSLSAGLRAVGKGMMEGGLSAVMKELDALGKKKVEPKPVDV